MHMTFSHYQEFIFVNMIEQEILNVVIIHCQYSSHFMIICSYVPNPVLVIIDVEPKELGIPTKAYYAVEEVKEV